MSHHSAGTSGTHDQLQPELAMCEQAFPSFGFHWLLSKKPRCAGSANQMPNPSLHRTCTKKPRRRGNSHVMHNHIVKYFILLFAIVLPVFASGEDLAISMPFAQKGVDGAVVISSLKSGHTFIHDDARANRRFT
jgi:hypothetical protein